MATEVYLVEMFDWSPAKDRKLKGIFFSRENAVAYLTSQGYKQKQNDPCFFVNSDEGGEYAFADLTAYEMDDLPEEESQE